MSPVGRPNLSGDMNREEQSIECEATSQGQHWQTVHHGYFADPEVARPLVDAIAAAMAEGYQLSEGQVLAIRDELGREFHHLKEVFRPEREGFTAWLHYHVLTCRAV